MFHLHTSSSSRSRTRLPRQLLLFATIVLLPVVIITGIHSRWRQHQRGNVLPRRGNSMMMLGKIKSTTTTEENDHGARHKQHQHVSEHDSVKYVPVPSGRKGVQRYAAIACSTNESISMQEWLTTVSTNSPIGTRAASDLSATIAASQYTSLLFETPGTSWLTSDTTPFEFVLVDEPALRAFAEGNPDRYAFAEHFNVALRQDDKNAVCSFTNLGGDSTLVSPVPPSDNGHDNDASYSHLAIFVRTAPKSQVAEFWRLAATTYLHVLKNKQSETKSWFSTNGMGVAWLHLRIDDRPKYYSYAPFKFD